MFGRTTPYLKVLGAAAMLVLIRFILLPPIVKNLEGTGEAMCGGNIDFLGVQLAIGPVVAGRLPGSTIDREAYNYRAILQRTGLPVDESRPLGSDLWYLDSDATPTLFPIQNVGVAQEYAASTIAALATTSILYSYGLAGCLDMYWASAFPSAQDAISKVMAEKTGVANHTCQYLKDQGFCEANTHAGTVQRFFCPKTCGVHNATSGLAYRLPSSGVPVDTCDWVLKEQLESLPCEDLPASDPAFQVYADSMQEAMGPLFVRQSLGNNTVVALNQQIAFGGIRNYSCNFALIRARMVFLADVKSHEPASVLLCDPLRLRRFGLVIRSLRYLCPVSCGCSRHVKQKYSLDGKLWDEEIGEIEHCPKKCFD